MLTLHCRQSIMFSMNKLSSAKRVQVLSLLCEGTSMRAASRLADVSFNTVSKLLVDAGLVCAAFHDETVRGVKSRRVQAMKFGRSSARRKSARRRQKAAEAGATSGRGRRSTPTASCSSRSWWATVARTTATSS